MQANSELLHLYKKKREKDEKNKTKKLVVHERLELSTFALSARRSTDWANEPSWGESVMMKNLITVHTGNESTKNGYA